MARTLTLLALAGLIVGCNTEPQPIADPELACPALPLTVGYRAVTIPMPIPLPSQADEGTKPADKPDDETEGLIEIAGDSSLPAKQRANACVALGKLGTKGAVSTKVVADFLDMLAGQTNSDWRDRAAVAQALGQLGDPAGLPALTNRARRDPDTDVRKAAVAGLAALATATARPEDRKKAEVQLRLVAQTDTNDNVRQAAADEVAKLSQSK